MNIGYLFLAVIAGFALPLQGALGGKLGALLENPMHSTFISYLGGLISCFVVILVLRMPAPSLKSLAVVDWYLFLPGVLGAIFVSAMMFLMPKIGIANVLIAAIVGQTIMSIALDHFGAFGNPEIRVSGIRVLGALLLMAGLFCIQYSSAPANEQSFPEASETAA
ncbi:DMT family transporter [Flexibacterium corallicola]|uniref:DMT family transporter n=1 Tax=Flexibacterium corallicola TaxID=3037259 RepID=UPI00286EEFFF|nr:DMT family transporter [Pseudovibrio sp. M1P-2-3]